MTTFVTYRVSFLGDIGQVVYASFPAPVGIRSMTMDYDEAEAMFVELAEKGCKEVKLLRHTQGIQETFVDTLIVTNAQ